MAVILKDSFNLIFLSQILALFQSPAPVCYVICELFIMLSMQVTRRMSTRHWKDWAVSLFSRRSMIVVVSTWRVRYLQCQLIAVCSRQQLSSESSTSLPMSCRLNSVYTIRNRTHSSRRRFVLPEMSSDINCVVCSLFIVHIVNTFSPWSCQFDNRKGICL